MTKINTTLKNIPFLRATVKQQEYIEILANDIGYNLATRKLNINEIIKRDVVYLDELSLAEASLVIKTFKAIKDERQSKSGNSLSSEAE